MYFVIYYRYRIMVYIDSDNIGGVYFIFIFLDIFILLDILFVFLYNVI
jgi:hypothetical protein